MKLFFKLLFGLFCLVLLGGAIFIMTFDLNSYRRVIVEKASAALNRNVTIDRLELKASLLPTVIIRGIVIDNPEGFESSAPFGRIDSAEVTLALLPLFQKQIQINEFRVGVAAFNFVNTEKGNNWTFTVAAKKNNGATEVNPEAHASAAMALPTMLSRLNIDSVQLENLVVSYDNMGQKQQIQMSDFVLKQLKAISFTLQYEGNAIKVMGTMNDLLDLLRQKPDYVFNLTIESLGITTKISGKIGDTERWRDFLIDFESKTNNLSRSMAQLKIYNKLIPTQSVALKGVAKGNIDQFQVEMLKLSVHHDGFLLDLTGSVENVTKNPKVQLSGNVVLSDIGLATLYGVKPMRADLGIVFADKVLSISKMNLTANRTDANLAVVISLAESVPFIKAQIASTYFNFQDFIRDTVDKKITTKTDAADTEKSTLFSDKPLDFSVLNMVNADVSLKMDNVELASQAFKGYLGVNAQMNLKDGLLNINPLTLKGVDGVVNGRVTVNASEKTPQINLNLNGQNMALDKIKVFADLVQGSVVNFDMNVSATGQSPKDLVGTLNGTTVMEVSEGTIVNKWFNALPMTVGLIQSKKSFSYSTSDQESKLNCAALNLNIKNGVIKMDKSVALETSLLNFSVSGSVDLPKETLSVFMVPSVGRLNTDLNQKLSFTQLVKISGPFNKLSVGLDAKEMVQNAAKQGLDLLAGKLLEKTGNQKTTVSEEPVNLCEVALGRKPKGKVVVEAQSAVKQTVKTQVKEQVKKAKESFKDELLKSVAEAIKK